jgi:hypothetical protein
MVPAGLGLVGCAWSAPDRSLLENLKRQGNWQEFPDFCPATAIVATAKVLIAGVFRGNSLNSLSVSVKVAGFIGALIEPLYE